MAFRITDDCIECLACAEVCPHQAVLHARAPEAVPRIAIDPSACTHCWPFDGEPRCVKACPVDCIVVDARCPVPPVQLIRRELEQLLSVAGPFEATRVIVQLQQRVREQFADAVRGKGPAVAVDQILDLSSILVLMKIEFSPGEDEPVKSRKTSSPAVAGLNV